MKNDAKNRLMQQGDVLCHALGAMVEMIAADTPTLDERKAALRFSLHVLYGFECLAKQLEVPDLAVMLADVRTQLLGDPSHASH